jgi:hypothetical protein
MAEPSTKSEMARSSECTEQYAQKVLDTADFVRDACLHQSFQPAYNAGHAQAVLAIALCMTQELLP